MPRGIKGWVFLVLFVAAVYFVWTRYFRSKVKA